MTNEEIVKALRQCAKSDCSSCGICPIFPDRECVEHLATAAANLIEQLIDENTELRKDGCAWAYRAALPTGCRCRAHRRVNDERCIEL